jgi:isopentenyl-diphosphate delta-isomerase
MSDLGKRKSDHLDLTIGGDVGFRRTTLLEQVELVHCSLPEVSVEEIDQTVRLFGKTITAPVMIASMTGGNERAQAINQQLAEVAQRAGIAIGLGSQRPMVKKGAIDREVAKSYQIRDLAPDVPLLGNIGVVQATAMSTDFIEEMVQSVSADALCVHLNPAQEMIQADGDRDFRGAKDTIARLQGELSVPIVVKETGCGLSQRAARALRELGVEHVDVSGSGGTSWVGVETHRAPPERRRLGELFWDWGIPTGASLLQVAPLKFRTVVATGGISSGLDVARAVSLGATLCGMARPLLQALDAEGVEGALQKLEQIRLELLTAQVLTGSKTLKDLRTAPRLLGPDLSRWTSG